MKFPVRILRRAEQDVRGILHFIAEERKAPEGAQAWYRAYEVALERRTVRSLRSSATRSDYFT